MPHRHGKGSHHSSHPEPAKENNDAELDIERDAEVLQDNTSESIEKAPHASQTTTVRELELESLRKEAADNREYKDKYLRLLADMENMRKRMQKEKQELTQYAIENVITDFLPPMDHMENALRFADQMSDEVKNWAIGFQMILTQFKDALVSNGIQAVNSKGLPFDPHTQEAVEMVETNEHAAGTVVEECVRGYKMGERTIRPARVKVAKAVSSDTNNENTDETNTN